MLAGAVLTIVVLVRWGIDSTKKIVTEYGVITYSVDKSSRAAEKEYGKNRDVNTWTAKAYTTITQVIDYAGTGSKEYKKHKQQSAKVPKYFKNYGELCQTFEDYKNAEVFRG